jgi:hypothetical protein
MDLIQRTDDDSSEGPFKDVIRWMLPDIDNLTTQMRQFAGLDLHSSFSSGPCSTFFYWFNPLFRPSLTG